MPRLSFGAFLAPHHPIGDLDKLGYEEFWCPHNVAQRMVRLDYMTGGRGAPTPRKPATAPAPSPRSALRRPATCPI